VRHRLDLFGVLVLSCAAAVSGGIARDVLIGAQPPAALADWRYLAPAMLAGVATFWWRGGTERLQNPVQLFDAAGLALFAVLGTDKALAYGLSPFAAMLLGMLSGIGGGIARDLLVARTPVVLQAELYAVAALLGGAVVAIGNAPTALFALLDLIDDGAPRPAAIVGAPVGFVGAAESKEALIADGRVPWLVVRGRKGGSAMTAAAVNALASPKE